MLRGGEWFQFTAQSYRLSWNEGGDALHEKRQLISAS